jgi:hypothetical protein
MLDTDRHSECVISIPFPLQRWFSERASLLRYTYIASFVFQSCDIFEHTTSMWALLNCSERYYFWSGYTRNLITLIALNRRRANSASWERPVINIVIRSGVTWCPDTGPRLLLHHTFNVITVMLETVIKFMLQPSRAETRRLYFRDVASNHPTTNHNHVSQGLPNNVLGAFIILLRRMCVLAYRYSVWLKQ